MTASIFMSPQTTTNLPAGGLNANTFFHLRKQKEKIVIVMGATGTGKSRLSIDIATHFPAEIINSDKMQVFHGLDIVTNKLTKQEQRGVRHHLLGEINPYLDFSSADFRSEVALSMDSIIGRDRLPIIAGGSNSYIESLIDANFRSKYECCFLWVDVSMPILHSSVSERVDKMVENGMVEEAREFFDPTSDYSRGIKRAIGVPEFDRYFRYKSFLDEETQEKILHEAISKIKDNTCRLACRQLGKIHRLKKVKGWKIHRLDATEAFTKQGKEAEEAWNKLVAAPSAMIVDQFLHQNNNITAQVTPSFATLIRECHSREGQPWWLQFLERKKVVGDQWKKITY